MNKTLSLPVVRSPLEHDLADWLHGCQEQRALDIAESIRRRSFLRLSVLDHLHALELVLDDEIAARVMSETVWPLDARVLWVIRHELSVLRNAIELRVWGDPEARDGMAIEILGEASRIFQPSAAQQISAPRGADLSAMQISVVAGVGFEPTTFRL